MSAPLAHASAGGYRVSGRAGTPGLEDHRGDGGEGSASTRSGIQGIAVGTVVGLMAVTAVIIVRENEASVQARVHGH